jgi:hypothetical protein
LLKVFAFDWYLFIASVSEIVLFGLRSVRKRDFKTAEVLLSYFANATLPELQTGFSALTLAFSQRNVAMAELLLEYGADLNATDARDNTVRNLAQKDAKMQAVVEKWDAEGAAGFEVCPAMSESPFVKS